MYIAIIASPYLLDSIDYIINVQCLHCSIYITTFHLVCLSRYLSSQRYIFLLLLDSLRYAPLSTFFLYSLHSILIYRHSLFGLYTFRPRSKPLSSTLVVFPHSFKHAQIPLSLSRLPTAFSNRLLYSLFILLLTIAP